MLTLSLVSAGEFHPLLDGEACIFNQPLLFAGRSVSLPLHIHLSAYTITCPRLHCPLLIFSLGGLKQKTSACIRK